MLLNVAYIIAMIIYVVSTGAFIHNFQNTIEFKMSFSLGISVQKPKYPQYAVLATRLPSFRNWPKELGQKPEDLAKAGFVYEGIV